MTYALPLFSWLSPSLTPSEAGAKEKESRSKRKERRWEDETLPFSLQLLQPNEAFCVSGHCYSATAVRRHLALHSANALRYLALIISGSLLIEIRHGR